MRRTRAAATAIELLRSVRLKGGTALAQPPFSCPEQAMTETPRTDSTCAVKVHPSPNHGERKDGKRPDSLVLHYTGMVDGPSALHQLCNPLAQVSSHYLVFEDGRTLQLVPEERRAWHAGVGCWQGERDMNSASIGIEIVNPGHDHGYVPFPDAQMLAVTALCQDIVKRWMIRPDRVIAHSDMAPNRKRDPGELFPWAQLAKADVGHWVEPHAVTSGRFFQRGEEGMPIEALQAMLVLYGYDLPVTGVFDEVTELTVVAFQRHFRQEKVDGVADRSTIETLRALIAARAI
jgi:N-acetylmuramoyl-L-alanine amidase